jgi:type II secretory pathway pseudopilin PulG
MARRTSAGRRPPHGGFGYLLLLVGVAVLSAAAAAAVALGHDAQRRDAEQALLDIGRDFRAALASYRAAGGGRGAAGPGELADLLRDPRQPGVLRHLRRIPADPLDPRAPWGLVRDGGGRIVAIHSTAQGRPIKRAGFEPAFAGFEDAQTYGQWQFGVLPAPPAASSSRP